MHGVSTVMEFITLRADLSEETYEKFSNEFTKNMVKSKTKKS